MDPSRRPVRKLEPKDGSSQTPAVDSIRASTVDSGRGSMATFERSGTLDSRATNGTLSALSRDTPLNNHEDTTDRECQDDEPIRIKPTSVLGSRCYEQAFVSHVDHPSAFFVQLAHFEQKYKDLHKEINEFYSKTPMPSPTLSWKRGDYCIAKYNDNEFYRARIIETPEMTETPDFYGVVFLDFGNWDKVALTDIHILLRQFSILTAQAIPCSLNKSLPRSGTWFDHPKAIKLFEDLVLEKYVDATFQLKPSRDYWQLSFVDLVVCSTKQNVRNCMKNENLIREVNNEEIYMEFNRLLKPVDYIIYSIRHEDEDNIDD